MANVNDAEITNIYVSQANPGGVQDDAPNAPLTNPLPAPAFDVTLEMVAGSALNSQAYTLTVSCANLTQTADALPLVPSFPPPSATIGTLPWQPEGPYFTYADTESVAIPAGFGNGQVYQYTASLISANGEVASIKQSDPFVLY
jgi:hypothetical protein